MSKSDNRGRFGTFFDPSKITSGARFYRDLCEVLSAEALPLDQRPPVVLFNISAPWREVLKAKWRGQKVVLRVDGLYCDRLSPSFVSKFRTPLRLVLGLGLRFRFLHNFMAHIANFFNQNYGGFLRILLADWIIYQSRYSYRVHQQYFSGKPSSTIVNGSRLLPDSGKSVHSDDSIRFVTIYDDWRPSKRMYEIVRFVIWLNSHKKFDARLTLLGYNGKFPDSAPKDMGELIETSPYITTKPRFEEFEGDVAKEIRQADIYLCFSYRDACPNAVVESMAHGLPVLGLASGGVPDIVGDAGELLPIDDFESGLFVASGHEYDFPSFEFEDMFAALSAIVGNYDEYSQRVKRRFDTELDIHIVAEKYASALRQLSSVSDNG